MKKAWEVKAVGNVNIKYLSKSRFAKINKKATN